MSGTLERLSRHKRDVELTFGTEHGKRTLAMLAEFCHVTKTTMVDGQASAELEGRRQVVLKIMGLLKLSYEDIADMIRAEEES
jgi:hypothetical protein